MLNIWFSPHQKRVRLHGSVILYSLGSTEGPSRQDPAKEQDLKLRVLEYVKLLETKKTKVAPRLLLQE